MYMYIKKGKIIIILLPHLQFLLQEMHIYLQTHVLMVPRDYAFLLKGVREVAHEILGDESFASRSSVLPRKES